MLLKILGNYDVVAVGSGAEAIETAMESKPDLVITDIRMPAMDGYALLGKLREFHPDLPVIAYTGYAKEEDIANTTSMVFFRNRWTSGNSGVPSTQRWLAPAPPDRPSTPSQQLPWIQLSCAGWHP